MATGIIAEYNPFHKGHKYHIDETIKKTNDSIVAIISGNFVQRGEPAMADKHTRAKMALLNGVSIVLELPVEYATASADVFAMGAVNILDSCGIVDSISFGSEKGETKTFEYIAEILNSEPIKFKEILKAQLNKGLSYPTARNTALEKYTGKHLDFLNKPNNILGLEYMRQLKKINSSVKPITVERFVSDYNSLELSGEISSASAIRTALADNNISALSAVPKNCVEMIKDKYIPTINDYSNILAYILRTKSAEEISVIADITEGLENKIINTNFNKVTDLLENIKSKRYTYSKLQRALLHIILNINKEDQLKKPQYIRVIGFRKDKKELLSEMTKKAKLPVVVNVKENEDILRQEIIATDIYNIAMKKKKGMEYVTPVVIV